MTGIAPTVNGIPAYRLSVKRGLGAPEDISYTILGDDASSLQAGALPPNGGIFPISLGGGTYATMLSTGAELVWDQPGYVTESGKSIGLALQDSAIIHRFTAQQITVGDAFNGGANSIAIQTQNTRTGNTNVITTTLPDQGGIAATPMGVTGQANALTFQYILDGSIQGKIIDVDIHEDNALHATEVICQRLGSLVSPEHTNFVIDSGAQTVTIGQRGGPTITFGGDDAPVLRASTAQAQTTDLCASVSFTGGDSRHGLPATGKITDLIAINDYAVVGLYSQIDIGGVYFWRGDGAFYPLSQAMGVNSLWMDFGGNNELFAATDAGIYNIFADVRNTQPWPRLGAMSLKCTKVQKDAKKIYTLGHFGTGNAHLLQFVVGTTQGLGYDDYVSLFSAPTLIDFAVMGDYAYCVASNNQGTITVVRLSDGDTGALTIPAGDSGVSGNIIGVDAISPDGNATNTVIIRTDQGSAQLFYVTAGAPFTPLQCAADTSLVDDYGAPVMVNSVRANVNQQLNCSTGRVTSSILAATSIGVFSCPSFTGASNWQRTDGQSSIGDFVCSYAAAGFGQADNVYAAGDASFYVSNNGSVNWYDGLAQPLDAGPYFFDQYWATGTFPPVGPKAVTMKVPYGGGNFQLRRTVNGINQYVYELINPSSAAPAAKHRSAELTELSAPALMSPITASRILVQAMARFLAYTAQAQVIVEVESVAFDLSSPLLSVQPGWAASVSEDPTDYIVRPGGDVFSLGTLSITGFVLEHEIQFDRDSDPGAITTKTRIGKLLLNDRTDINKDVADMMYSLSRQALYRSKR